MQIPAEERKMRALLRRLPPGERRDRLERLLPDRGKAVERFRKYAQRAEQELPTWELNWMSMRIVNLLEEDMFAVMDEIKAEEAERKRIKGKLKVIKR